MAATAAFPFFASFPPEIRTHIWSLSLPRKDWPAICFYKKGCWCPRELQANETGYLPSTPFNWALEFRYDLLNAIRVKVAQDLVNFEARSSVLKWARGEQFEIQSTKTQNVILRPANPIYDVIYVREEDEESFRFEQSQRLFQSDLRGRMVDIHSAQVKRLAIPEVMLRRTKTLLDEISELFPALETIYIILYSDSIPDDTSQHRWELDYLPGPKYSWKTRLGSFQWEEGETGFSEDLCELIEEACGYILDVLSSDGIQAYEVQLATMKRI